MSVSSGGAEEAVDEEGESEEEDSEAADAEDKSPEVSDEGTSGKENADEDGDEESQAPRGRARGQADEEELPARHAAAGKTMQTWAVAEAWPCALLPPSQDAHLLEVQFTVSCGNRQSASTTCSVSQLPVCQIANTVRDLVSYYVWTKSSKSIQ